MFHDIRITLFSLFFMACFHFLFGGLFSLSDLCAFGICCFGSIKHASFFAINFDYIFPLLLSHT